MALTPTAPKQVVDADGAADIMGIDVGRFLTWSERGDAPYPDFVLNGERLWGASELVAYSEELDADHVLTGIDPRESA